MPLALPQWHATRISWAQTWMSGWQLAPEKFPQLYQRFHPQALRYHHPCWSERKHLLFNQPLTAWTDRMALFQGLSMSTPSPPQVYGAAATHRWIQTTHIEAAATARDVTQDTVSENRYRQQLNFRFFLSSCQFHFTDGRAGFPHPPVFRPPFHILFTTGILFQPVALTTHHTRAGLHYRVSDICCNSYGTKKTWVTATKKYRWYQHLFCCFKTRKC